jgi:hypothetical protein
MPTFEQGHTVYVVYVASGCGPDEADVSLALADLHGTGCGGRGVPVRHLGVNR